MVARVHTVAFAGIEAIDVEAQVTIASGLPAFTVVGLPDKAVAESRERVRAALTAMGLALPREYQTFPSPSMAVVVSEDCRRPLCRARGAGGNADGL